MDIPEPVDDCGPTIIYGVESENIEEINDAYGDMITDMGEIYNNKYEIHIFNLRNIQTCRGRAGGDSSCLLHSSVP